MKKIFKFILLGFLMVFIFPSASFSQSNEETIEVVVQKIVTEKQWEFDGQAQLSQVIEVLVTKGSLAGQILTIESGSAPMTSYIKYEEGDKLLVLKGQSIDGADSFAIADYVRQDALVYLFIVFVVAVVVVAKWWGLASIFGMGYSFLIIFKVVLPWIIAGGNPVLVAVVGASLIVPVTFYLSHGFNTKTHVAIMGTLVSLLATAFLAAFFVNAAKLFGFGQEEAIFLLSEQSGINLRGVLLAGIIIGLMGILDDITVSQASVVDQLHQANKKLSLWQLFTRGMAVGRDHISSLVNTLVLVYAGSALPLFLLFVNSSRPYIEVISYEPIAEEIVRTLVGSIGLVLAVPITTWAAAYYFSLKKDKKESLT